jgi:hypothetical protein
LGIISISCLCAGAQIAFAQGSLNPPPGTPAPTMKTQDQIEPRTPISALPFAITNPGSYYVARDLTGVTNQNGITILTDNVSLDLSGFALRGIPGSLDGIHVSFGLRNIAIRNGTIRDWGAFGVNGTNATNSQLENLMASDNGGAGLTVDTARVITPEHPARDHRDDDLRDSCFQVVRLHHERGTGRVAALL